MLESMPEGVRLGPAACERRLRVRRARGARPAAADRDRQTTGKEVGMPALQVRDFPDDLYEKLKACAAMEHRSVAQQTVALVEEGLNWNLPSYAPVREGWLQVRENGLVYMALHLEDGRWLETVYLQYRGMWDRGDMEWMDGPPDLSGYQSFYPAENFS